ncbi:DUF4446 family protein [Nocardiopsis rhodophaea]|uniref:DUF4446 family protein n=1 Tax=Nocardiopsis rhodophaea TaxID=280238 RepID=UPI00337DB48A
MLTLTMTLAVLGMLTGVGGLGVGGYALMRSRTAIGDYHALLQRQVPDTGGTDARAIRDVAVVRYDALEEMSGARSFSLALLNAAGDGVVISSINGRTESRTYAKSIQSGRAGETLSPEEYRAIRAARLGQGLGQVTVMDAQPVSRIPPLEPARGAAEEKPRKDAPKAREAVPDTGPAVRLREAPDAVT